jgi:hypothetical protein
VSGGREKSSEEAYVTPFSGLISPLKRLHNALIIATDNVEKKP